MPESEMPMYPDESDTPEKPSETPDEKMEGEEDTFLVSKSALAGKKVGDKCTVEVVHEYDDELEVRPVKEDYKKKEKTADEEIDELELED